MPMSPIAWERDRHAYSYFPIFNTARLAITSTITGVDYCRPAMRASDLVASTFRVFRACAVDKRDTCMHHFFDFYNLRLAIVNYGVG